MKTILYIALLAFSASVATAQVGTAQLNPGFDDLLLKPRSYIDTTARSVTADFVTLSFPKQELENATVVVTDLKGKLLMSGNNIEGASLTLDVSGFDKGVYVISIENKGAIYSSRFIKP